MTELEKKGLRQAKKILDTNAYYLMYECGRKIEKAIGKEAVHNQVMKLIEEMIVKELSDSKTEALSWIDSVLKEK